MPALRRALREESLSGRKRNDPVYDGSCLQAWAERATGESVGTIRRSA